MLRQSRRLSGNAPLRRVAGWDRRSAPQAPLDGRAAGVTALPNGGGEVVPSTVDIMSVRTNGIINPEIKHLIKRYLRRIGFLNVKVVHLSDCGPATMTLSVTGQVNQGPSAEQRRKLDLLNDALTYTLTHPKAGVNPHPSHADPEMLRMELTKVEPSMGKEYYARA
jgi:hypothetical protein